MSRRYDCRIHHNHTDSRPSAIYCFWQSVQLSSIQKREYETDSRFYRFLINSAALCILKSCGFKCKPPALKKYRTIRSRCLFAITAPTFDPIITWYILRKWEPAFISKDANFKIPFMVDLFENAVLCPSIGKIQEKALKTINKAAELVKRSEVADRRLPGRDPQQKRGIAATTAYSR